MGKGGADIYQSPYQEEMDSLGAELLLGMITGQPISPSPRLNNFFVAQSLGGDYDAENDVINLPDGTTLQYDPLTDQFTENSKQGTNYLNSYASYQGSSEGNSSRFKSPQEMADHLASGGQIYNVGGGPPVDITATDLTEGPQGQYAQKANEILQNDINGKIYGDNSAYNLFSDKTFGEQYYNPETGLYEGASGEGPPAQLTGDYYLNKYGGYLDQGYDPTKYNGMDPYQRLEYQSANPYEQFDYNSATINTVDPINQALTEGIFNRRADELGRGYRSKTQDVENTIAELGGSLTGGRAAAMRSDATDEYNRSRDVAAGEVATDAALRSFYDAAHVRDMQAAQDMDVQKLRAGEGQFGYNAAQRDNELKNEFNQEESQYEYNKAFDENQTANEFDQEENQFGFNAGQKQGSDAMSLATGADLNAQNSAREDLQANRQQALNKITALQEFLKLYAGQDSTAGQLAAAQNAAVGNALNGVFGAAGTAAGAKL